MKHADKLIDRILFLEGLPNLQRLGNADGRRGRQGNPRVRPEARAHAHPDLQGGDRVLREVGDYVSRDLLEPTSSPVEEEHIDTLETQFELLGRVGLQNYQQSQIKVS